MSGNSYDDIIQNYIMYQQMGIDTNTAAQYYQQAQASSTTPQNQSRGGGTSTYNKPTSSYSGNKSASQNDSNSDILTQRDTIFIQNLPKDVTVTDIEEKFGCIGIIKIDKKTNKAKIWIYKDKNSGEGKGEATVTYDDEAAATAAIDWFNNKEIMGNIVKISLATRKNNFTVGFGGGGRGRGGGFNSNRGGGYGNRGGSSSTGGGFGGNSYNDRNSDRRGNSGNYNDRNQDRNNRGGEGSSSYSSRNNYSRPAPY